MEEEERRVFLKRVNKEIKKKSGEYQLFLLILLSLLIGNIVFFIFRLPVNFVLGSMGLVLFGVEGWHDQWSSSIVVFLALICSLDFGCTALFVFCGVSSVFQVFTYFRKMRNKSKWENPILWSKNMEEYTTAGTGSWLTIVGPYSLTVLFFTIVTLNIGFIILAVMGFVMTVMEEEAPTADFVFFIIGLIAAASYVVYYCLLFVLVLLMFCVYRVGECLKSLS